MTGTFLKIANKWYLGKDFSAQYTEPCFFWGTEGIIRLLLRPLNNLKHQEQHTTSACTKKNSHHPHWVKCSWSMHIVSVTVALPCDVTVHAQSSVRGSVVRAGGARV